MQKKGLDGPAHGESRGVSLCPLTLLSRPRRTMGAGGFGTWSQTLTRFPRLTLSMGWAVAMAPPVCSQIQCQ